MNNIIISLVIVVATGQGALGFEWTKLNAVDFELKEVFKCEDSGTKDFDGTLRLNRKNRTLVVMEGNVTLKVPVDDSLTTTVIIYKWNNNGGWKQSFTFNNLNICNDFALLLGYGWTSIWTHAGLTPPIKCPIPKGDYELKDFDTQDFIRAKVPAMAVGRFKLMQTFQRNKQILGCINYIVELKSNSLLG